MDNTDNTDGPDLSDDNADFTDGSEEQPEDGQPQSDEQGNPEEKKGPGLEYDSTRKYIKRSKRVEWVRVNILGKVIVRDDGTCVPGEYCTPKVSEDYSECGLATKYVDGMSTPKYYVMSRVTDHSVMIQFK